MVALIGGAMPEAVRGNFAGCSCAAAIAQTFSGGGEVNRALAAKAFE